MIAAEIQASGSSALCFTHCSPSRQRLSSEADTDGMKCAPKTTSQGSARAKAGHILLASSPGAPLQPGPSCSASSPSRLCKARIAPQAGCSVQFFRCNHLK